MNSKLRGMILEAQRTRRQAEGRPTPEDVESLRQLDEMKELKTFVALQVSLGTAHEITPVVEWTGSAAVARFTLDEQLFTILKDPSEFVLFAGDEHGQELTRLKVKDQFQGTPKVLNALGDFFSI